MCVLFVLQFTNHCLLFNRFGFLFGVHVSVFSKPLCHSLFIVSTNDDDDDDG